MSLVFLFLFVFALIGQAITGLAEHNSEMKDEGGRLLNMQEYLSSGHFIQATFENWESEFFQMGLFVILTIWLYQKGSSESKDPDGSEEVDNAPNPRKKDAPWPVRKGGFILALYKNSLSLSLFILFMLSFLLHWYGSWTDYNEEQMLRGDAVEGAVTYLANSRLWFESFQNWQSEFLSVLAIVILSVFLRQKGSPQSKPVDAPNSQTGGS